MSDNRTNLHGTAIRINHLGILCVGASGTGKSELAFSLIAEASRWGADCALIADDQILLGYNDETIVAYRPNTTKDLIELRGSAIISIKSEEHVALSYVVTRELANGNERLPPADERFEFTLTHSLPLIRLPAHSLTPYAKFSALVDHLCLTSTFAP